MFILKKSILALFVFCAMTAFAHDMFPPDWRGQAGTSYQHWRFDTNENPAQPEIINNPYGQATATMTIGDFGEGWAEDLSLGLTGLWNLGGLGGSVLLDIPSQSSVVEYKDILVQVTYYTGIVEAPTIDVPGATFLNEVTILVLDDPPLGKWELHQSHWRIYPAPDHEQILIISDPIWGSVIDQIVVDTKFATAECIVDFTDLVLFIEQWLDTGVDLSADFDISLKVDYADFAELCRYWLDLCPDNWPLK